MNATAADATDIAWRIDRHDCIVATEGAWDRFALENDGADVVSARVLGRSLWDFVTGLGVREVYEQLLERARGGHPVQFRFRCDAPSFRRSLSMRIEAQQDRVVTFRTTARSVVPRAAVRVLDRRSVRTAEFVRACAWCSRILAGGEWVDIESAVNSMRLLERTDVPQLTHGICDACAASAVAGGG